MTSCRSFGAASPHSALPTLLPSQRSLLLSGTNILATSEPIIRAGSPGQTAWMKCTHPGEPLCTKLPQSDTLVLISLIAHTQRSALSDAALITNDRDGFCPSVTSTGGSEYTPWWVFSPTGHCSSFTPSPRSVLCSLSHISENFSDCFPITKWVHEATPVFCVEMMHSLIHST